MIHYADIKCLPDCDEHHADDCPREKAEREYWAKYFGAAHRNFAPLMNKWCPFCQRVLKVSSNQNECPVCNREELQ